MRWIARLIADLQADGAKVEMVNGGESLLISSYNGDPTSPIVKFTLSADDVDTYIDEGKSDAVGAFPATEPAQGSYQLLLVLLEELIDTCDLPQLEIKLVDGELETEPADRTTSVDPIVSGPGYAWVTEPTH
ncbi:MAG: hypothetical protein ACRDQZ_00280 [Mycobacteriales bacterium]